MWISPLCFARSGRARFYASIYLLLKGLLQYITWQRSASERTQYQQLESAFSFCLHFQSPGKRCWSYWKSDRPDDHMVLCNVPWLTGAPTQDMFSCFEDFPKLERCIPTLRPWGRWKSCDLNLQLCMLFPCLQDVLKYSKYGFGLSSLVTQINHTSLFLPVTTFPLLVITLICGVLERHLRFWKCLQDGPEKPPINYKPKNDLVQVPSNFVFPLFIAMEIMQSVPWKGKPSEL